MKYVTTCSSLIPDGKFSCDVEGRVIIRIKDARSILRVKQLFYWAGNHPIWQPWLGVLGKTDQKFDQDNQLILEFGAVSISDRCNTLGWGVHPNPNPNPVKNIPPGREQTKTYNCGLNWQRLRQNVSLLTKSNQPVHQES